MAVSLTVEVVHRFYSKAGAMGGGNGSFSLDDQKYD